MVSHIVKPKEVRGLVADVFYCNRTRFKHILPDILFFMCGGDEGGRYEEFVYGGRLGGAVLVYVFIRIKR
jgi:hypothetical protein